MGQLSEQAIAKYHPALLHSIKANSCVRATASSSLSTRSKTRVLASVCAGVPRERVMRTAGARLNNQGSVAEKRARASALHRAGRGGGRGGSGAAHNLQLTSSHQVSAANLATPPFAAVQGTKGVEAGKSKVLRLKVHAAATSGSTFCSAATVSCRKLGGQQTETAEWIQFINDSSVLSLPYLGIFLNLNEGYAQ